MTRRQDNANAKRQPADLAFDGETMRRLGYGVVDHIVDHLTTLSEQAVVGRGSDHAAETADPTLPEQASDPEQVIDQVVRDVFSAMGHVQHPRFFGWVPGPSNYIGVLADALTAGFNPFVGTGFAGAGPTRIELTTIDWLRTICGLPTGAGGLFVSGGSVANLTALAVARFVRFGSHDAERARDAVVYFSDQTHSSIERALRILGFADRQLRRLPSDPAFRLDLAALHAAIDQDRAAGRIPWCVVANAGTTNTGAVDPLTDLVDLCRQNQIWLHADGAYGAAAALCPRGQALLSGLGAVDSVALDPHKWLFQPFEIGAVLVRERHQLRAAFKVVPEYLRDVERAEEEVHLADYGIQLTRGFRALKLWMTFKVFGAEALRAAVARGIDAAESAEHLLRQSRQWEIVSPASLGVIAFRYAPPGDPDPIHLDALHGTLVERLVEEGFALTSSTVLRGRTALRLCTINPRSRHQDLVDTLEHFSTLAAEIWASHYKAMS